MKRLLFLSYLLVSSAVYAGPTPSPPSIEADRLQRRCSINFSNEPYPRENGALGSPVRDIKVTWQCMNGEREVIDQYSVEGGSPEVVTVLFWKKQSFLVLVKWTTNSHASDFQGDFYRLYIYKFSKTAPHKKFTPNETLMSEFGEGWDGVMNGVVKEYQFKDAASIRRKLQELGPRLYDGKKYFPNFSG
ncbi:hypothetical protein [Paraburkholderia rhizosphaerae]|uniref:Uncharacterized protein n=1 Tax=Paraburkholderia rhizosphaerae TaxID=480658 RepID=A0A4R8LQI4_9BURK|nr:hypothetical protein [Paraburkholderia rhizosphaerae]TDY49754.1 hypothetical protein BX592_1105 [Paraburkholderia rhizosphaerae]